MDSTSVVVFLIGLAIFAFFISMTGLDNMVKSHRAQVWISTIAICVCFWSVVAAVIVGLSSGSQ
jgi:lysylphosphatidylglycerol synthetase-like protein (DUF2156 family)